MSVRILLAWIGFLAIASHVAYATDPTQLQDFCVGMNDPAGALFVNSMFCKNPMAVTVNDFVFDGLNIPRSTKNRLGSNVTQVNAAAFPGLNTLGISFARIDYAPHGGLNAPHIHPRGTELLTVIKGTLYAGFVASNQPGGNRFFTKVLHEGNVIIFPQGMIHFQLNIGNTPAVAYSFLSSQNPGVITIANATFGAKPSISVEVLSKAFQLDPKTVKVLQSLFA